MLIAACCSKYQHRIYLENKYIKANRSLATVLARAVLLV